MSIWPFALFDSIKAELGVEYGINFSTLYESNSHLLPYEGSRGVKRVGHFPVPGI